ncbi:hypothetical protein HON36_01415, partial [Candidatus Parcubacteria bacterium]|nr:hypothetical protein [Candidatus Parcubacteria bacterium]
IYYVILILFFNKTRTIFYSALFYIPVLLSLLIYFIENPSSSGGSSIDFPAWAVALFIFICLDILALIDYEIRRKKIKNNNQLSVYTSIPFANVHKIFAKFSLLVVGILFLFFSVSLVFTLYMQEYTEVLNPIKIGFDLQGVIIALVVLLILWVLIYFIYRGIRKYDDSKNIIKILNIFIFNITLLISVMAPGQLNNDIERGYYKYRMVRAVVSSDLATCEDYYKKYLNFDKAGTMCQEMLAKYKSTGK